MDAGKTGAYLAALRKARGMTQQEAADQLGVSNKTVSKWENGAGLVSGGNLLMRKQSRNAVTAAAAVANWRVRFGHTDDRD